jgi:hypothetical protein
MFSEREMLACLKSKSKSKSDKKDAGCENALTHDFIVGNFSKTFSSDTI